MPRVLFVVLVAALASAAGACDSTSGTTVPSPSPATTTETFTGTIGQFGEMIHPFSVATAGSTTIGLTSVEPLSTMALGVAVGSWDGTTCGTAIAQNANARASATALTGTAAVGNYCVRVYDSGNVPESWAVNYSVEVIHPDE